MTHTAATAFRLLVLASLIAVAHITPAAAQVPVPWLRGFYGLEAGTSPPPGVTALFGGTWYHAGSIKDNDGDTFAAGDLNQFLPYVAFFYTSKASFLGANWGAMISVNWANVTLDLPELDVSTTFGPSDLYVRPLNFGWNWSRGDLTLAYALFVPTGRYVVFGDENTGSGLWSNEFDLGGTVYLGRNRRWNLSTLAAYQSNSAKRDTRIRPGSTLSLYGGAGYTFKEELANAGIVYYAQWKVSDDELGVLDEIIPPEVKGRQRIFGLGVEVDYPLQMLPDPLVATARYFFEFGNRSATQGGTLYLGLTYVKPASP